MTTGCWIIQLYNVPTTNRLNLLGYSFPQKTIRVQGASLKVVIMLPFWVLGLASQLRQEKWEIFLIFLLCFCLGIWTVKMFKCRNTRAGGEREIVGGKNSDRKNDKGLVNYALWEGKFSETNWSKGWGGGRVNHGWWLVWEQGELECVTRPVSTLKLAHNILR